MEVKFIPGCNYISWFSVKTNSKAHFPHFIQQRYSDCHKARSLAAQLIGAKREKKALSFRALSTPSRLFVPPSFGTAPPTSSN